ncbi:MAG: alpha-2-macroglobulin [Pirellulaceae bacterium]|nr:alpha-2-macroglobulin [Pirellulaceae bacterium]
MNRRWILLLLGVGILLLPAFGAGPREDAWKQVDQAMRDGLPKTAIERLEPIIRAALAEKKYAEAIKAITTKIAMEGTIQGNKPEERITRLHTAIETAPPEMQPMMEAVLANWYWHYFRQNSWRFMRRTATSEPPGEDFTTWDLPRLFAEIDQRFAKALAASDVLKTIPVADYDDLLVRGTMPDRYRPTLYDFVAYNALEFYTAGEQAGAKPQDAFQLTADSPMFSPADQFVGWKPPSDDEDSPVLKAVLLYQELLRWHQDDADQAAFLHADLERLVFGWNKAFGEEKNARYKAALKRFVDRFGDEEISALARHHWARVLQSEGDLVEARRLAEQGWRAFPETPGGRACYNLIQQIEAKSASVTSERVWNKPWPTIQVTYRNVNKVFFRMIPWDFQQRMTSTTWHPENLDQAEQNKLLTLPPALSWSADLPATDDYQQRTEDLPAPQDLKPGFYFLVASHDADFGGKQSPISYAPVWVSQLALVTRIPYGAGFLEGFVLDADSGEPLVEARVRVWQRTDKNQWLELEPTHTDTNGQYRLQVPPQNQLVVLAEYKQQSLATGQPYNLWTRSQQEPYSRTILFTDRSLYRPGQTIQYKGICIRVDQNRDDYKTLGGQSLTLLFVDANGQEIARQTHRANDYGSFSGSFTAPRDRLMGRMYLRVEGEPHGQSFVNVEEYKRPKFQVSLEAPKTAAKLNESVVLQGTATSYTGAAIDGAKVRWRVVRQVQYPSWWHWRRWWMPPVSQVSQEIANGSAITEANGGFAIEFTAKPDLSVAEKDEPTFQFSIFADVTDTAGETRSAQRVVQVGYTALRATLAADSWLTNEQPVAVRISTTTLDGEGQQAEGSLKIHRVQQPESVKRPSLSGGYRPPRRMANQAAADQTPEVDPSNPDSWPLGDLVAERGFTTDPGGNASQSFELPPGLYRALLATQDRFGKPVTAELPLRVLDPTSDRLAIKVPNLVGAPKWTAEPGDEFSALWGSGYDAARAFVEIEHRGKIVQSYWTDPKKTQVAVKQSVTPAMRGGFTLRVTMVRENRAYLESRRIDVPWTDRQLQVRWERFVSKLGPGQQETWTAVISGPDAKKAVAEMVATLYDESLDAYLAHRWSSGFGVFRQDSSFLSSNFENSLRNLNSIRGTWPTDSKDATISHRAFPYAIVGNLWGYSERQYRNRGAVGLQQVEKGYNMQEDRAEQTLRAGAERESAKRDGISEGVDALTKNARKASADEGADRAGGGVAPAPDLSQVAARSNLNETAFFFPHLVSDSDGQVKLEFTMPEALTKWKFMGFAHDAALRSGYLEDSVVTAKDLMVQPNPPRFLREGDELEFTVKVTNQSPTRQTGSVRLTLADARTGDPADAALGNSQTDQPFDVPAGESRSFAWRLAVPDGLGLLTYKAVGSTGRLSDGEEGYLPVLSRRILVTGSLPLPIRGPETKRFDFKRLIDSGESDSLRHQSLTVQMVSNPAWYAVMALPYLMEYPHQCSEQVFNRLYANALARHIAASDPKIRRVFDQWKGTDALESPLEKNQDLKAVLIEETPWVRQAQAESQARQNVGILFDANRLNDETSRTFRTLSEMQRGDGFWPWFPGGPGNQYITLYIVTGFGRLRHLGSDVSVDPAVKSLGALDAWVDQTYREILQRGHKDQNHLNSTIALYLYGRSFFLKDKPIDAKHREAVDYFLGQSRKHWLALGERQSQAHLALALKRFGDLPSAQAIMRSIKERSVEDEELGMFWRDTELSWWWYRAPIETQAMMIEALDEVMNDVPAVEACRVWLLKQKQTQDWKTTKATADAVYALLLRGTDILASNQLVQVTLGDQRIEPERVEAGTGFFEKRLTGPEIKPGLGRITVAKSGAGVAWGSVHWQYLEDVGRITPYEGTPLRLDKQVMVKRTTARGPVLSPVDGPLEVGDEVVVRIVLRTDRDMEYVHLKDQRPSGSEPVDVLSQYKYQDGLYYYQSARDTASHFFIDYLPKGTYVFEYSIRIQNRGRYQTGMAQIQCMYAPEFNSHSASVPLETR